MNVGIIGTGGRSLAYLPLLSEQPDTKICAICDNDPQRLRDYHERYFAGCSILAAEDYREVMASKEVDTVLILTPDTAHRAILESAVRAGKHILLEKPIATTLEDAKAIYEAGKDYPKTLAVGFVLRYTPFYSKIHEIVAQGTLGKVISITAKEMLDTRHAASFYRRWHRFSKNNGGLMNAKCSHDMDLLHWMAGSEPAYISAFGGNRVFLPREDGAGSCKDCPIRTDCKYAFNYAYYEENFHGFHSLSDLCVYNSEKDIVDHESMNIQYQNGVIALFELCMVGYDENRFMNIHGTEATLTADFNRSEIRILPLKGEAYTIRCSAPETGHGGGDQHIIGELRRSVTGETHINHVRAGYLSTAAALPASKV